MPRDYVIEDGVMWHNTSLMRHKRKKTAQLAFKRILKRQYSKT